MPARPSMRERLVSEHLVGGAPVIERHGTLYVVRDDMVLGGTKARVAHLLFEDCRELVYASPAEGYAQVALAVVAGQLGKTATVFVAHRQRLHPHTLLAGQHGAQIVPVRPGYLNVVAARAREYVDEAPHRKLAPFGFGTEEIVAAMAEVASQVARAVDPPEVWSVAGSGTLSRALQLAFPQAEVRAVSIGKELDPGLGWRAEIIEAPERFGQRAELPPPFPSNGNYDAKAWRFIRERAQPGALFWNVAA